MTIPPRAVRFRIRRRASDAAPPAPQPPAPQAAPAAPLFRRRHVIFTGPRADGADTSPGAGAGTPAPAPVPAPAAPAPAGAAAPIVTPAPDAPGAAQPATAAAAANAPATPPTPAEAVRAEGLTGRQLRIARRIATSQGIAFEDDFDAVVKLRARGIDPFRRNSALVLLQSNADPAGAEAGRVQLPQTVKPPRPPAPAPLNEGERVEHIMRIQRDIVRRRRQRLAMLAVRLCLFVLLPTIAAGLYYFRFATPLYVTRSEFVIQQAEAQSLGGVGSLFKGTQFATSQDSITVQSYLQSREAMLRLDKDMGFRAAFSGPAIDPLQRIAADATTEDEYKVYKRNVKISYDPTEGIIRMDVIAPDPQLSKQFSEKLIHYAEEQVDKLSLRLREDQMQGARESYVDAEAKVAAAQARVLDLQRQVGVLDPVTENSLVMTQISTFEVEQRKKELELQQLLDNPQPNQARVAGTRGDITRLRQTIEALRAGLTRDSAGSASLASIMGQLRIAEGEMESRQLMLGQAMQQMEAARIAANRQTRYLSMGVNPLAPDAPTYPRAFENTILALLIFSGIYLMLSLTAAILREQVSS